MSRQKAAPVAPSPDRVDVILLKPHTHAGKWHDADARISVSAADAQWLIDNNVARAAQEV